jgi:hypothetical protein
MRVKRERKQREKEKENRERKRKKTEREGESKEREKRDKSGDTPSGKSDSWFGGEKSVQSSKIRNWYSKK